MAIPDFQSIMLPLLRVAKDGVIRATKEYREKLALEFCLSEEELDAMLPSGVAPLFANRVAWAIVYLQRAGLLARPARGKYHITEAGRKVLSEKPEKINIKYLKRFEVFNTWQNKSDLETGDSSVEPQQTATPEEILGAAYSTIRSQLATDILEQVKSMTPKFFERLVIDLLVAMGYGGTMQDAGKAIGKGGDEGIDGIIKEDRLGLDVIYIQAKRWDGSVGRPEVQKFVGALSGKHAQKGVFITTGSFAKNAEQYVATINTKVVLIDGKRLAEMMIDFDIGVATRATYRVKRIDNDYFVED
ncbi:MAG: restriction endonuclease [Ignavibacteriae bacterium]|nr:restriction endonuclease [Ignavibacteriota bacterium]